MWDWGCSSWLLVQLGKTQLVGNFLLFFLTQTLGLTLSGLTADTTTMPPALTPAGELLPPSHRDDLP